MSIKHKPENHFDFIGKENAEKIRIGVAVAEWNSEITKALLDSCTETLKKYQITEEQIIIKWVPGSFELPLAAQWLFEYMNVDAVACLGCIIKGETPHFHFISDAVAHAICDVGLKYNRTVSFGIITAEKEDHALERAGGSKGNKGEEAAMAILRMLRVKFDLKENSGIKPIGFR